MTVRPGLVLLASLGVALVAAVPPGALAHHSNGDPVCFSNPPPPNAEGPPEVKGYWEDVVDLGVEAIHTVHLPLTGKVLAWGYNNHGAGQALNPAPGKIYDPATGALTDTAVPFPAFCGGQAHLADGRVLVVGGRKGYSTVFDPATETFTTPVPMYANRFYPTATSLDDGRVFVHGGTGARNSNPEIYDPATDSWTPVGCTVLTPGHYSCRTARSTDGWYPHTVLTADHGLFWVPANRPMFAESFDFTTNRWTRYAIGAKPDGRMDPAPAVYYATGRMLRAGSDLYANSAQAVPNASIVDFTDQAHPFERPTNPMSFARNRDTLVLLPDGTILVHGGKRESPCVGPLDDPYVYHPEIWDPATEQWTTLGPMQVKRVYHSTAILLRDGSILSAGGEPKQTSSQIFHPPYLYKGPRPVVIAAPAQVQTGTTFEVLTPNPLLVSQVNLLRLGAVTHAYDQSQRIVRLAFTSGVDRLTVTAPQDGYEAPPGYYMLFLISDLGVPSIAEYVQVEATEG